MRQMHYQTGYRLPTDSEIIRDIILFILFLPFTLPVLGIMWLCEKWDNRQADSGQESANKTETK